MKSKIICSILGVFSLGISGCSQLGIDPPEQPLSTTGVAAATGAALGGGLGAIIGSTTGNVGGGLVLGTIAGATTGGLVGRELERQEEDIAEQREKVARQEQLLAANRKRFEEVRKSGDIAPSPTKIESYHGSSRAKPFDSGTSGEVESPRGRMKPAVREEALSSEVEVIPAETRMPSTTAKLPAAKPIANTTSKLGAPAAGTQLPPPQDEAKTAELPKKTSIAEPLVPADGDDLIGAKPQAKVAIEKAQETMEPPKSDCAKADAEASRARAATSDADRLFYLRRALRLCPNNARYKADLGKVYASIGRVEDAEKELRQSLELDPTNEEARKQLTSIRRAEGGSGE